MDKYTGKRTILVQNNLLLRDTIEGSVNNVSDFFRREIGNHYVLESGKGLYFRRTKYDNTYHVIQDSVLSDDEIPNVIIRDVQESETGAVISKVKVQYRSIPNVESSVGDGIGRSTDYIYQQSPEEDVDGMAQEYNPPQTSYENIVGSVMSGGVGEQSGPVQQVRDQDDYQNGVVYGAGGRYDDVPNIDNTGNPFEQPLGSEIGRADDAIPEFPTEVVSSLDAFEDAIRQSANVYYDDFNFSFNKHYTKEEVEQIQNINNPLLCDVVGGYNFYHKQFEDLYYNDSTKEVEIPNLYDMYADNTMSGNLLEDHSVEYVLENHYKQFSRLYNIALNFNEDSDVRNWNEYARSNKSMPSSVEISLGMDESRVASAMNESVVNNVFLVDYLSEILADYSSFERIDFNEETSTLYYDVQNGEEVAKTKRDDYAANVYDIVDWFNRTIDISNGLDDETARDLSNDISLFDISDNSLEILSGVNEISDADTLQVYLITSLLSVLKSKINSYIYESKRSYKDLFEGKTAEQETLLYTVVKKEKESNNILQRYVFFNSNTNNILKYVDSQIKYGKQYKYEVYAHKMVYGTSYVYSNVVRNSNSVEFDVQTRPVVKIIEVPVFEKDVSVFDRPPIFPEVQIKGYREDKNNILIELNNGIGEISAKPISINESDEVLFEQMINSANYYEGKFMYGSDDIPKKFEVYRIDKEPSSYRDFEGHKIKTLETNMMYSSMSFIDNIENDKGYYYTFRTVDIHDNFSNPTEIYFVKIVTGGVRVRPIFSVYPISYFQSKQEDYKKSTENMKRFVMIKPSVLQEMFSADTNGIEWAKSVNEVDMYADYKFGIVESSVWGKTYKMRVRSKSTGRTIDFNFRFTNRRKE